MGDKMVTKSSEKVAKYFYCENCDYTTSNKFNYDKHLLTAKHLKVTLGDAKVAKNRNNNLNHICSNCNKQYKDNSGLWRHSKKCCKETNTKAHELIQYLIKENSEFKQLMIEQNKHMLEMANKVGNNNNNTTNNNNNFNLMLLKIGGKNERDYPNCCPCCIFNILLFHLAR